MKTNLTEGNLGEREGLNAPVTVGEIFLALCTGILIGGVGGFFWRLVVDLIKFFCGVGE